MSTERIKKAGAVGGIGGGAVALSLLWSLNSNVADLNNTMIKVVTRDEFAEKVLTDHEMRLRDLEKRLTKRGGE